MVMCVDKRIIVGIFFSISAAIFFSLSNISVRRGVLKLGVPAGTAIMLLTGTVPSILIAIFFDDTGVLFSANLRGILFFAIAGVIQTAYSLPVDRAHSKLPLRPSLHTQYGSRKHQATYHRDQKSIRCWFHC